MVEPRGVKSNYLKRARSLKWKGDCHAAEYLEVHPVVVEGERDEKVGAAQEQENAGPGKVQPPPFRIR